MEASIATGELAEPRPALALVAGEGVVVGDAELRGALRRAVLLLATGGDPRRELALESRAVAAVAEDLADEVRAADLQRGLESLRTLAGDLPLVAGHMDALLADPVTAWRAFACALVADELVGE